MSPRVKIRSQLLLGIVMTALINCYSLNVMAQTPDSSPSVVPALPAYQEGESYRLSLRWEEDMQATGSPMGDWTMENQFEQFWDFTVKKEFRDGTTLHEGVLMRTVVSMDMGKDGKMKYDTEQTPVGDVQKHFDKQIDTKIKVRMDIHGEISEVEGAEGLQDHMFKKDADYNGNHWLAETWNFHYLYPGKAVGPNDSWELRRKVTSFYPLVADFMCTVADAPTKKGAVIMVTGFVSSNPNSIATNERGMQIDYQLRGAASGYYNGSDAQGRINKGELHWDLKGECLVDLPDGSKSSFPVTIKKFTHFHTHPLTN